MSSHRGPTWRFAIQSCRSYPTLFEAGLHSLSQYCVYPNHSAKNRERPDTIRSIVANLVGDDDSGDSLVDENEPIQPLHQPEADDFSDPSWEPEPIDAGPGKAIILARSPLLRLG